MAPGTGFGAAQSRRLFTLDSASPEMRWPDISGAAAHYIRDLRRRRDKEGIWDYGRMDINRKRTRICRRVGMNIQGPWRLRGFQRHTFAG